MITPFHGFDGEVLLSASGETRFYCGKLVDDPAIEWRGHTAEVFLHPGCAIDFIIRLTRDVHQWQCSPLGHSVTGR